MNKNERIEKKEIEEERNSKLICYITGARSGFETRITKDVINLFYEHLLLIRIAENIDLLIPKILLFICKLQNDVLNCDHKSPES